MAIYADDRRGRWCGAVHRGETPEPGQRRGGWVQIQIPQERADADQALGPPDRRGNRSSGAAGRSWGISSAVPCWPLWRDRPWSTGDRRARPLRGIPRRPYPRGRLRAAAGSAVGSGGSPGGCWVRTSPDPTPQRPSGALRVVARVVRRLGRLAGGGLLRGQGAAHHFGVVGLSIWVEALFGVTRP